MDQLCLYSLQRPIYALERPGKVRDQRESACGRMSDLLGMASGAEPDVPAAEADHPSAPDGDVGRHRLLRRNGGRVRGRRQKGESKEEEKYCSILNNLIMLLVIYFFRCDIQRCCMQRL